jgi:transposase
MNIANELDPSAIYASDEDGAGRGRSTYAPARMVRVVLYGYWAGIQFAQASGPDV